MKQFLTTGEIAEQVGCERFQIRELFAQGLLPEPPRFGQRQVRAIPAGLVPEIRRLLEEKGLLKT